MEYITQRIDKSILEDAEVDNAVANEKERQEQTDAEKKRIAYVNNKVLSQLLSVPLIDFAVNKRKGWNE